MGCYETVTFKCPSCGAELSAQSKGGPCEMSEYPHYSVPLDVATDANRHAPITCDCGKSWRFAIPSQEQRIFLPIIPA
jgi:hypothetical protein